MFSFFTRRKPSRPAPTASKNRFFTGLEVLESRAMLNGTPVASNDTTLTTYESEVQAVVTSNDTVTAPGASIDYSTVSVQSAASHGTVTYLGNGTIKYVPDTGYSGSDSFTYTFDDTLGNTSNAGTVSITVEDLDPPVAVNDTPSTPMNSAVVIDVLVNDSSAESTIDATTVSIVTSPTNGSVTVNSTTGAVTYTPNQDFIGSDSFQYTVKDVDGRVSNTATTSIDVTNDAPTLSFEGEHLGDNIWLFRGTIIDEDPQSVTLTFGGILAGKTIITVIDSDGKFSFDEDLAGEAFPNVATAQAEDTGGLESSEMSAYLGSY